VAILAIALQALGVVVTILWTGIVTWAILAVIRAVMPLRVSARDEAAGLDVGEHGEEGYTDGEGAILVLENAPAATPLLSPEPVPAFRRSA
jgi:Amt family ammonium transporter